MNEHGLEFRSIAVIALAIMLTFFAAAYLGSVRAKYQSPDVMNCKEIVTPGFGANMRGVESCAGKGCDHPEICTMIVPAKAAEPK